MPSEKFYPHNPDVPEGSFFEVLWSPECADAGHEVHLLVHAGDKGYGLTADRATVNRMIKALRKARDRTFGKQ